MIYKFTDKVESEKSVEFRDVTGKRSLESKETTEISITINNSRTNKEQEVRLTTDDLFELIGGLLRIQSKYKK